jgi:hypothetical protein
MMARKQEGVAGACPCRKHSPLPQAQLHTATVYVPCSRRRRGPAPLDDGGTSGKKASIGRSENMWVPLL